MHNMFIFSCRKNARTCKHKAEKERAEKLLEAAKAEAVLRVGYWTDFFPIDSSTDCHVEIPMFIEQNNFQVKFLKGLIEVFV